MTDLQQLLQSAEATFPVDSPVMMVNLLRYRDAAARRVYFEAYLPAFNKVAAEVGVEGVEIAFAGHVEAALLAPSAERWDDIAIVRYPSFAAFRRIATSAAYAEQAEPHRDAALAELRLYATSPAVV